MMVAHHPSRVSGDNRSSPRRGVDKLAVLTRNRPEREPGRKSKESPAATGPFILASQQKNGRDKWGNRRVRLAGVECGGSKGEDTATRPR
jgi:hypothetical protein